MESRLDASGEIKQNLPMGSCQRAMLLQTSREAMSFVDFFYGKQTKVLSFVQLQCFHPN
jgi:hypothetical protein